jgi:hypothetical protein
LCFHSQHHAQLSVQFVPIIIESSESLLATQELTISETIFAAFLSTICPSDGRITTDMEPMFV